MYSILILYAKRKLMHYSICILCITFYHGLFQRNNITIFCSYLNSKILLVQSNGWRCMAIYLDGENEIQPRFVFLIARQDKRISDAPKVTEILIGMKERIYDILYRYSFY